MTWTIQPFKLCLTNSSMVVSDWCCSDSVMQVYSSCRDTHLRRPCCSITDFIISSRNTVKGNLCHQRGFRGIKRDTRRRGSIGMVPRDVCQNREYCFSQTNKCDNESTKQAHEHSWKHRFS